MFNFCGSAELLLVFVSTVIPSSNILEMCDEDLCSPQDVYKHVFRNGVGRAGLFVYPLRFNTVTVSRTLWTLHSWSLLSAEQHLYNSAGLYSRLYLNVFNYSETVVR
jgi:hypothetical protein